MGHVLKVTPQKAGTVGLGRPVWWGLVLGEPKGWGIPAQKAA